MGDLADDIVDGLCCQYCGQYFVEAYGSPWTCNDCMDPELTLGDIDT